MTVHVQCMGVNVKMVCLFKTKNSGIQCSPLTSLYQILLLWWDWGGANDAGSTQICIPQYKAPLPLRFSTFYKFCQGLACNMYLYIWIKPDVHYVPIPTTAGHLS